MTETKETSNNRSNSKKVEFIIEKVFDKFSAGLRIIGPLFAFALTIFVLIVTHAFFSIILPYYIAKIGILISIILIIIAIYLLINILFNYFMSVIIKPGSLEDIKNSKYYKKVDPLNVSENLIDLRNIFLNKENYTNKTKQEKKKVEVKLRLKTMKDSKDNIIKEAHLLNANQINDNSPIKEGLNINNEIADLLNIDEDEEKFSKELDEKLSNIENNDSNLYVENSTSNDLINNNEERIINNDSLSNQKMFRLSDCKYCKQEKPVRAHHCSVCGICVLKMDHHCPWINNCIGQNNHRYFVLFLTHLMFGCLFICITDIPIVFSTNINKTIEFNFVAVLSFVGFILMIFFNSWNWFLVMKGNTTIEFWTLKGGINSSDLIKNFSMQNWKDNIFIVFGTKNLFKAVFVPSYKKLPMSGLEWTKLAVPSYNFEVTELYSSDGLVLEVINSDKINKKV